MYAHALGLCAFQSHSLFLLVSVMRSIEEDMEVIAVTGVEDQLQPEVRTTLERLHHAGIKVWMLTGDKVCACILHALFYHMYTHNGVGTGDDACDLIRVYLLQACICVAFWHQGVDARWR